jgi:hypothetical protein
MKRIAAVLGLASVFAIGASSSASAAGDPLHVRVCNYSLASFGSCVNLADVSVRQAAPGLAALVNCDPAQQTYIPINVPLSTLPPPLGSDSSSGFLAEVYICQK